MEKSSCCCWFCDHAKRCLLTSYIPHGETLFFTLCSDSQCQIEWLLNYTPFLPDFNRNTIQVCDRIQKSIRWLALPGDELFVNALYYLWYDCRGDLNHIYFLNYSGDLPSAPYDHTESGFWYSSSHFATVYSCPAFSRVQGMSSFTYKLYFLPRLQSFSLNDMLGLNYLFLAVWKNDNTASEFN